MYYNIELQDDNVLRCGFGEPAQNDDIVRDVVNILQEMNLPGGKIIKVNGPASLPVAMVLAHALSHRYETVGCYDPKLGSYVVAISHGPTFEVGQLID